MADKQKAALNRLSKKLSALRATLSKDERILLDRIVLGGNEVSGHRLVKSAQGATAERNRAVTGAASSAQAAKSKKKANELALHGMTAGVASGSVAGAKGSKKVNEVALHGMAAGVASGSVSAVNASKKVNEVALHGMTAGVASGSVSASKAAASGAKAAAANAAAALLEFDATTGGYRLNDAASI